MSRSVPTVGEVGERHLVDQILEVVGSAGEDVLHGAGDDAAVVRIGGRSVVVTTDSQHEGIHFDSEWLTPGELGRRIVAINVSDIGAMGATPRWAVAALALPPRTPLRWVRELMEGMHRGGEQLGCRIVGGDVARVPDRIGLCLTAIGILPEGTRPLLRSGARPGHGCWITGRPGRAAAGRLLLARRYRYRDGGDVDVDGRILDDPEEATDAAVCIDAYRTPQPPVGLGAALAESALARALIDLSDGLALDLLRVCEASGVGVAIDGDRLGDDVVLRRWHERGLGEHLDWILGGGDDYELLLAVPPEADDELIAAANDLGVEIRRIGSFVEQARSTTLKLRGRDVPLERHGWDHFAAR